LNFLNAFKGIETNFVQFQNVLQEGKVERKWVNIGIEPVSGKNRYTCTQIDLRAKPTLVLSSAGVWYL